ncbi:TetR/AcrR family transcriptional regulator [Amycolatopsis cihanbeyliensis]|uniref:TetR family transcriptional regulator n=1 Tax=Amycolatopsis cihanbeyliensis TaxID=1128664 RepID=A0A542DGI8_AMYCI|nr:TetR/AcrR family transcriptional regulator [Amycolatopsis cihanbeyliensis]TQJ02198.1 TetR family transcriptional regulator [Amycolatopsis cihanbeyliensis]
MARTKSFEPEAAVDSAMEVFWTKGYANTSPQDLVDALGIGRGSLYNAFHSKHELYQLALRRYHERETDRLIKLLDGSGSPAARVRSALTLVLEAARQDEQRRGCMATNAAVEFGDRDEAVNHLVRRSFERQEAALRSTIEEGQRAGEFAGDLDPATAAGYLLTVTNGIRVLAKAEPDARRLTGLADLAMRSLRPD